MQKIRLLVLVCVAVVLSCNVPNSDNQPPAVEIPREVEDKPPLSDELTHRLDSLFNRLLRNYRFNGNVLVAIEGYPVFRSSMGFRDLYAKDSLDLNTVFQIASVSKGFTAMAVLMLNDRGLISLDDTVKKYIPEFPFDRITVRMLLQHTSGLQNYMYYVDHQWDDDKHITNEDVLDLLIENDPRLNFTPGRRHHYNNTGYAMLALLVERVSDLPFHEFLEENIFDPLDMDNSFAWNLKTMDTIKNIAKGFTRKGWRYRKFAHNPLDEVLGDKSVYSTIDDLLKWDQALYENRMISDDLLEEAFSKTTLSRNRTYNYGYGWRLKGDSGYRVVYHNGLWNGFTSSLTRYVDEKITIIILNNTNAPVASIVRQIYRVLQKELERNETVVASS